MGAETAPPMRRARDGRDEGTGCPADAKVAPTALFVGPGHSCYRKVAPLALPVMTEGGYWRRSSRAVSL